MPKTIEYVYCDTCVFVAYFNQEAGRVYVLDTLFEEIHKGVERKLITSTLAIVEVAHVSTESKGGRFQPSQEVEARLDKFWADRNLLTFVDFHSTIARDARKLIRQAKEMGLSLKPADAIHLASAANVEAITFLPTTTYQNSHRSYLSKYVNHTSRTPDYRGFEQRAAHTDVSVGRTGDETIISSETAVWGTVYLSMRAKKVDAVHSS